MSQLSDYNSKVDAIIQDDAGYLDSAEIDDFIQKEATQLYSQHKPFEKVNDIAAANTYDYAINGTNFPSWSEGFSYIINVEYPAGEYQDPSMIEFENFDIYETSTTKYLRFLDTTPSTGTIRVRYTIPHSITASTSTVYDNDFGAFCNLAAAFCCGALARRFAQVSDSTIGADAVAYRDKSDVYASRMKELTAEYVRYMFPENKKAAFVMREFDTLYGELGFGRLTHPYWTR